MLLVVDVGNTNTVFAIHDGSSVVAEWRCVTVANRTADEYFVWLTTLMAREDLRPDMIDAAVVGSVVPAATGNIRTLAERYFAAAALVVGEVDCAVGIELRVDRPAALGADRIANAVGAGLVYGTDLIIVDFGTATTFDVVDGDGAYAGGVIAPGIRLSLDALHRAAASLPKIGAERPTQVVGSDTVPAMQSGIYWGYLSLIDGICARISEERGCAMVGIATGGLAPLFAPESQAISHVAPQLTIHGLVEIYRRNSKK